MLRVTHDTELQQELRKTLFVVLLFSVILIGLFAIGEVLTTISAFRIGLIIASLGACFTVILMLYQEGLYRSCELLVFDDRIEFHHHGLFYDREIICKKSEVDCIRTFTYASTIVTTSGQIRIPYIILEDIVLI